MPNIAKVLKDEISRIARRETNTAVTPARKAARGLRRTAAELRRKVALLEKEVRSLQKKVGGLAGQRPPGLPSRADAARITAKGMRSLRRRLRLTGQEFARLLGLTAQVVYGWEKANGPLRVRQKTRAAILAVRDLGARQARRLVDEMKTASGRGRMARTRRKKP
jgi:DNA-binding XRE family transcriptional regulator